MGMDSNIIQTEDYQDLITEPQVIGLISRHERAFLHYYARDIYSAEGEMVDLGTWLGASTFYLAKGLHENKNVTDKFKRIHAYDLFSWEESLSKDVVNTPYENKFKKGDDYKWLFLDNTKLYEPEITPYGNVLNHAWNGRPVEFLFVDAMKNVETTHAILRSFYSFLIPGKSFLVYQDFDHYLTPWVHLLIYRFRDYFTHIHDIPYSGGTVFKMKAKLPPQFIQTDIRSINEHEAEQAYAYCLNIACEEKKANIAAAHVMYYYYFGKKEHAMQVFNDYLKKGYSMNSDLKDVKNLLY